MDTFDYSHEILVSPSLANSDGCKILYTSLQMSDLTEHIDPKPFPDLKDNKLVFLATNKTTKKIKKELEIFPSSFYDIIPIK